MLSLSWLTLDCPVFADQVIIRGVTHTNAKINGLENGKLQVRVADGRTLSAGIDDVQLMQVDRGGVFDDFNQAEQFLHDGEALKAVARYERTLRLTQDFWPDLIACRLAAAHDRANQLDRFAPYFVRVVNGQYAGVAAAARLYPSNMPLKRDGRAARAVDLLADEARKGLPDDRRILLEVLRFDILDRTDPAAAKGLAQMVADLTVPSPARTRRIYSVILRAMQNSLAISPDLLSLAAVNRALRDCPDESLPGFLIVKGKLLTLTAKTREDYMHAAWAFLRVPIHMPNDDLAPKGLLEAARVLVAIQQHAQAKALVAECLNHPKLTDELRREAQNPLDLPPKAIKN